MFITSFHVYNMFITSFLVYNMFITSPTYFDNDQPSSWRTLKYANKNVCGYYN